MKSEIVIVTGGGSGFGRAICRKFLQSGYKVIVADVGMSPAEETVSLIKQGGGEACAFKVDVSKEQEVKDLISFAVEKFGRIDVLVNNAGVWEIEATESLREDAWDRVININLKGVFFCCKAVIPVMKKQKSGRIVNIGSVASRNGGSYAGVHYAASKGGVLALTKNLAKELGQFGICVNGVNPGPSLTHMTESWPEEMRANIIKNTPSRRLAIPEDIAEAVVFLSSEKANFINGETIEVNGGLLCD